MTSPAVAPVLEIHALVGGYAAADHVVKGVSLAVSAGELVTVIGPNGITTDALSTAVSVAGPTKASRICAPFGAQFHTVRSIHGKLETVESPGFRRWERR